MSHAFELRLFAAPRVLRGGEAVPLGSRKAIAILAVLALDGATARDRLAPLLWPDGPAPKPGATCTASRCDKVAIAGGRRRDRRRLLRTPVDFGVLQAAPPPVSS